MFHWLFNFDFSPLPAQSALNCGLNSLFAKLLEDTLQEELYAATIVGGNYSISSSIYGITVRTFYTDFFSITS